MSDPGFVVHDSTGNVFEDMGMPDAAERLARYERERTARMRHREQVLREHEETQAEMRAREAPTPAPAPPPAE